LAVMEPWQANTLECVQKCHAARERHDGRRGVRPRLN
jgi:hypothetical protein